MIITSTCHNHCTFCDGSSTAEEMVNAAVKAGFTDFGMSCHSYAPFDIEYSIKDEAAYITAMRALQKEYAGVCNVSVGIEQEFFAPVKSRSAYDYLIASVHYLYDERTGTYYPIDASQAQLKQCIDKMFDGDAMAMVRAFYAATVKNVHDNAPDVIGHFDLVTKYNEGNKYFDEQSDEYMQTALDALCACAQSGAIFEVNTGGVYRKAKTEFYPARFLLEKLCALNAKITLTADAHCSDAVAFGLNDALSLVESVGFKSIYLLKDGKFAEIHI